LQRATASPYLHPGASVAIEIENREVGAVGELHPEVAANFGIEVACAVMEIDLDALQELPRRRSRFREVSRQPLVRRDLAVVVAADQPAGQVLAAVEKAAGQDLVSVELFDRYAGSGVPEGKVSLAFRLVFQRADRTLTEEEVTKATDRVVKMLSHRFGGELR